MSKESERFSVKIEGQFTKPRTGNCNEIVHISGGSEDDCKIYAMNLFANLTKQGFDTKYAACNDFYVSVTGKPMRSYNVIVMINSPTHYKQFKEVFYLYKKAVTVQRLRTLSRI
jgi:hypothetical protein